MGTRNTNTGVERTATDQALAFVAMRFQSIWQTILEIEGFASNIKHLSRHVNIALEGLSPDDKSMFDDYDACHALLDSLRLQAERIDEACEKIQRHRQRTSRGGGMSKNSTGGVTSQQVAVAPSPALHPQLAALKAALDRMQLTQLHISNLLQFAEKHQSATDDLESLLAALRLYVNEDYHEWERIIEIVAGIEAEGSAA